MSTRTLTAIYTDHAQAESAAERLRAIGIPEKSIEIRPASEGDVAPGNTAAGLFAVGDLLRPEGDAAGLSRGGGTVLVAFSVPDDLASEAAGILKEDANEVENQRDAHR